MSVIKLPKANILELESHYLNSSEIKDLIKVLKACVKSDLAPQQKNEFLEKISSSTKKDFSEVYRYLINDIKFTFKKKSIDGKHSDLKSDEIADVTIDDLLEGFEDSQRQKEAIRTEYSDPTCPDISNLNLLSYLCFPYLGQFEDFKDACSHIQNHLNSLQDASPQDTRINYHNDHLQKFLKSLALVLYETWACSHKEKLVLLKFAESNLEDHIVITPKEMELNEFQHMTVEEIALLKFDNFKYLFNQGIYENLEEPRRSLQQCLQTNFLNILYELGLVELGYKSPYKMQTFEVSKIDKKLISHSGIKVDLDLIHYFFDNFHYDVGFDCNIEDDFQITDEVNLLNSRFYSELHKACLKQENIISLSDYKSQLIIKALNGDQDFFSGATRSPGHALSLFDEMTHHDFANISPYMWLSREEELDPYVLERAKLFTAAINVLISNNLDKLATSFLTVAMLGEIAFLSEEQLTKVDTDEYLTIVKKYLHIAELLISKDPSQSSKIVAIVDYFNSLFYEKCALNSFIQKDECIAKLDGFIREHKPTAKIQPITAPLPFQLPDDIYSQLDEYSIQILNDLRWRYNDFLAIKNLAKINNENSKIGSSRLQNFLQTPFILIEHSAKKFSKKFFSKNINNLGSLMHEIHRDASIIESSEYLRLLENTKKKQAFYKYDLSSIRNWASHPIKNNYEMSKYTEDDYLFIIKTVLPELLIFFYETS